MVAAVGRLDIGEVGPLRAKLRPVDIALPARDVDAVHGELLRRMGPEIDRLGIAELAGINAAALLRHGQHRRLGPDQGGDRALGGNRHANGAHHGVERLRLRRLAGPGQCLLMGYAFGSRLGRGLNGGAIHRGGRHGYGRLAGGRNDGTRLLRGHPVQKVFRIGAGDAARQGEAGKEEC